MCTSSQILLTIESELKNTCTGMVLFLYLILYSDINECDGGNPCLYGGTCQNTLGDYFCLCLQGRTGKICEESK